MSYLDTGLFAVPVHRGMDLEEGLKRLNEQDPPTYWPPWFVANYRHPCLKARQAGITGKGVSTAIELKERYVTRWDAEGHGQADPEDEFALLYREGMCKKCGQVARSRWGRVVRTAERPPVQGRVGRE